MLEDLLNKQVICPDPSILQFMYPNFKLVKSEFAIFPDEPFIWNGDPKYISKIKKRPELHIIIANTGEYDLTDPETLVKLAYIKNGKFSYKTLKDAKGKDLLDIDGKPRLAVNEDGYPIKEPKMPQYIPDLLKAWKPDKNQIYSKDFIYNWKHLWVTGSMIDKEVQQNKLFLSIIENITQPFQVLQAFLKAVESGVDISRIERSLLKFFYESMKPQDMSKERKLSKGQVWYMQRQQAFYQSYSLNIAGAIDKHLKRSKYLTDPALRVYMLLLNVLKKSNNIITFPRYNKINVTYKNKDSFLEEKKYLASQLSRTKEVKTTLLLGDLACTLFKQIYKGDMYTLKTSQDVREFRETYNYGTDEVLVFEDLSLMTPDTQAALLKFIEEPKRPLIVLCSNDNISGAMMSRFAHKVKLENKLQIDGISIKDFIDARQSLREKLYLEQVKGEPQTYTPEEDEIRTNFDKACLHLCPEYWYYNEYAKSHLDSMYNLDLYIALLNY